MSADAERRQPRPLADMHAHYPMHVAAGEDAPTRTLDAMRKIRRKPWRDKLRALVLRIASRLANKRSWWTDDNRVTVETMQAGDVRLACSVLYSPFEEIDFDHLYGAAPDDDYFDELRKQMRAVEADVVAQGPDKIRVVTDRHGLDEAQA